MPLRRLNAGKVFNRPIFNHARRDEIVSRGQTRIAKAYVKAVRDNMVFTKADGVLYKRRSGSGFVRYHRASSWGSPPAVDTTNLINSIKDEKVNTFVHEVFIDTAKAPYSNYLVAPRLNRPIFSKELNYSFGQRVVRPEYKKIRDELMGES